MKSHFQHLVNRGAGAAEDLVVQFHGGTHVTEAVQHILQRDALHVRAEDGGLQRIKRLFGILLPHAVQNAALRAYDELLPS